MRGTLNRASTSARREPPYTALVLLRPSPSAERLGGATVVWVARRPEGGTVVVGWYRNASVYREMMPFSPEMPKGRRFEWGSSTVARAGEAVLIPAEERWFSNPRATHERPGGIGQANVWNAEAVRDEPWYRRLEQAIVRGQVPRNVGRPRPPRTRRGGRLLDPEMVVYPLQHLQTFVNARTRGTVPGGPPSPLPFAVPAAGASAPCASGRSSAAAGSCRSTATRHR